MRPSSLWRSWRLSVGAYAVTDGSGDPAAVKSDDGKWIDKNDVPTFKVEPDGTVDWYTYVGFTRYSSECLRCHGPDGMGSTYAPALMELMKRLSYTDFYAVVAGGKQDVSASQNLVMPANGENKNVMCFIDAIYIYLRARADDAVGRGRPESMRRSQRRSPRPRTNAWVDREAVGSVRFAAAAIVLLLLIAGRAGAQAPGLGASVELVDPKTFRVCADPRNLPFSDEAGEGFENKLAELFARKLGEPASYTYYPAGHRLRAQHAECPALRCDHGRGGRRRPRADHQSLLPHDLCAGVQARQRTRRHRIAGGSAAEGQAYRHRRRHAAGHGAGAAGPDGAGQALCADGRYARRCAGADDGRRYRGRADRRRRAVGSDRRLLCAARRRRTLWSCRC